MRRVFICYRRNDQPYAAKLIHDRLVQKGYTVTIDIDIPPSTDFVKYLNDEVNRCDALLAIIGDSWESDRLRNAKDFVRLEIHQALRRDIPVFPVLVGQARIPATDSLPSEIKALATLTAAEVRPHANIDAQVDSLIRNIDRAINTPLRIECEHLAFTSADRVQDGRNLVDGCFHKLQKEDPRDYPPRLFILLATVDFRPFNDLLLGIREGIEKFWGHVPLIGCSVAGVLYNGDVHDHGCVLMCLASKSISVKTKDLPDVISQDDSVQGFCNEINSLYNPKSESFLLCLVPGYTSDGESSRYLASELFQKLHRCLDRRIPIFGAAAADEFNDKSVGRTQSWQFAGDTVHTHGAVAALVESNVPFGISIEHGIKGLDEPEYIFVNEVSDDGCTIFSFEQDKQGTRESSPASEVIERYKELLHANVFLDKINPEYDEGERIILYPRANEDGSVTVAQPVWKHWPVEVLRGDVEELNGALLGLVKRVREQNKPLDFQMTSLVVFACVSRYEYAENVGIEPRIAIRRLYEDEAIKRLHKEGAGPALVGGLVYGEIGQSTLNFRVLRNWTVAGLMFGKEDMMRP